MTTEGESLMLTEATETMEESSAVATTSLTKRKAESDHAEEIEASGDEAEASGDENDESGDDYVDPDDELLHPTWFKVPEWDVDSFDGLEYDSSEYKDEFPKEEHEKLWRRFKRQLIENKGFYVEPELWPMYNYSDYKVVPNLDLPASYGQTYREYFAEMACLCLQKYNQENRIKNGFDVEFVEVVRGIFSAGSRSKSYITFMAKEKPDGPLVEYQAKVWCTVIRNQNYPILCRRAPATKPSNQN